MAERPVPEPRARLGAELRRVRLAAGASQNDIGDLHQSVVSKIEHGRRMPTAAQVELWLHHAGNDDDRGTVRMLLAVAQRETSTWSEVLQGKSHLQDDVRDANVEALRIRNFQPTVLPGMLQTAEYARLILKRGRTDVAASVASRIASQELLYQPGRSWEFLVAEEVLHCRLAPSARLAQLDRIAAVSTLESVRFAVLPTDDTRVPWNNFIIRDPADGSPPYVASEQMHGPVRYTVEEVVIAYDEVWDEMWGSAVKDKEARVELERVAALYR